MQERERHRPCIIHAPRHTLPLTMYSTQFPPSLVYADQPAEIMVETSMLAPPAAAQKLKPEDLQGKSAEDYGPPPARGSQYAAAAGRRC